MEKIWASKLVEALEHATLMAKQLPTADPSLTVQIYSTLHAAHLHLSSFLSHSATATPPPQPSLQLLIIPDATDTSTSPMLIGDDVNLQLEEAATEDGRNSFTTTATKAVLDGVEEELGTRDFFMIRNKGVQKKKRSLSPTSAAVVARGVRRGKLEDQVAVEEEFDPSGRQSRALELIH